MSRAQVFSEGFYDLLSSYTLTSSLSSDATQSTSHVLIRGRLRVRVGVWSSAWVSLNALCESCRSCPGSWQSPKPIPNATPSTNPSLDFVSNANTTPNPDANLCAKRHAHQTLTPTMALAIRGHGPTPGSHDTGMQNRETNSK